MKKVKDSQGFGEWAEDYVAAALSKYGWVVERLRRDYGLDLIVQPTGSGIVRGHFAFVQVKGRRRYINKEGYHRVRLERRHLQFWMSIPLPIYVAVVYRCPEEVYIVNVNNYVASKREQAGVNWLFRDSHTMLFPAAAKLIPTRLSDIAAEIGNHHAALERVFAGHRLSLDRDYFAGEELERSISCSTLKQWMLRARELSSRSVIISDYIQRIRCS